METLARFRTPPTDVLGGLAALADLGSDEVSPSTVPGSWLPRRRIGTAQCLGRRYADVYSSEWLSYLRRELESDVQRAAHVYWSSGPFDLGLLLSQDRHLTQKAATLIYNLGFDGIYYHSRHGRELFSWALFEPFHLTDTASLEITADDRDLQDALRRLDLTLDLTR